MVPTSSLHLKSFKGHERLANNDRGHVSGSQLPRCRAGSAGSLPVKKSAKFARLRAEIQRLTNHRHASVERGSRRASAALAPARGVMPMAHTPSVSASQVVAGYPLPFGRGPYARQNTAPLKVVAPARVRVVPERERSRGE